MNSFKFAEKHFLNGDIEKAECYWLRSTTDKDQIHLPSIISLGYYYLEDEQYTNARKYFDMALKIDKNNADIHYGLALLHSNQDNADMSIIHLEKACLLNHPAALYAMSQICLSSTDNDKKIIGEEYLEKAAKLGHTIACYLMAEKYMKSLDIRDAIELYTKSATNGFGPAFNQLGKYCMDELNEFIWAKKCFLLGIKCGSIDAFAGMGKYYQKLGKIDFAESYFNAGINKRSIQCMVDLGKYYEYNGYVRKTIKARSMYEKAIKLGSTQAMINRAILEMNTYNRTKIDSAVKYMKMAIDAGSIDANYLLVTEIFDKNYNHNDNREKLEYLNRGAELGHIKSIIELAIRTAQNNQQFNRAHLIGNIDHNKYRQKLMDAVNLKSSYAMRLLAMSYYNGQYFPNQNRYPVVNNNRDRGIFDVNQAIKLFEMASELGDVDSIKFLQNHYENTNPEMSLKYQNMIHTIQYVNHNIENIDMKKWSEDDVEEKDDIEED
jgi:TPR repeat protein